MDQSSVENDDGVVQGPKDPKKKLEVSLSFYPHTIYSMPLKQSSNPINLRET